MHRSQGNQQRPGGTGPWSHGVGARSWRRMGDHYKVLRVGRDGQTCIFVTVLYLLCGAWFRSRDRVEIGRPHWKLLSCPWQEMALPWASWSFSPGSPLHESTNTWTHFIWLLPTSLLSKHLKMHLAQPPLESTGVQQAGFRESGDISAKPERGSEALLSTEEKADMQTCSKHPRFIFQTTSQYNYTLAGPRKAQYRCSQPGSLL